MATPSGPLATVNVPNTAPAGETLRTLLAACWVTQALPDGSKVMAQAGPDRLWTATMARLGLRTVSAVVALLVTQALPVGSKAMPRGSAATATEPSKTPLESYFRTL